jgi:competence ComEA-like helix-hairpin-helix protein
MWACRADIAHMPTPSEQKALAFVVIVILLGGVVRVLRAGSAPPPTPLEQQGIARQARAADSASAALAQKHATKGKARRPRASDTVATVIGGVSSVPPSFARPDQPFARSPFGYPPPSPRIDILPPGAVTPITTASDGKHPSTRVDVDRASASDIEKLPRIGPAMARRIVANRDSLGAFKTLQGLRRVKGIGPATLKLIADLVVFSGGSPR